MGDKSSLYVPYLFKNFQGFQLRDIKEFHRDQCMEIHLDRHPDQKALCARCGSELGHYHSRYPLRVRHLRVFNYNVNLCFSTKTSLPEMQKDTL